MGCGSAKGSRCGSSARCSGLSHEVREEAGQSDKTDPEELEKEDSCSHKTFLGLTLDTMILEMPAPRFAPAISISRSDSPDTKGKPTAQNRSFA